MHGTAGDAAAESSARGGKCEAAETRVLARPRAVDRAAGQRCGRFAHAIDALARPVLRDDALASASNSSAVKGSLQPALSPASAERAAQGDARGDGGARRQVDLRAHLRRCNRPRQRPMRGSAGDHDQASWGPMMRKRISR